jgi:YHS domain-containing protein
MARFEKALESWVNHDVYYFSDSSAKEKFDEKPWKWSGKITDPVTLKRFKPKKNSPRAEYEGRPYFFASDSTRTVFLADPAPRARARAMGERMAADSTAKAHSATAPDTAGTPATGPPPGVETPPPAGR